MKRKKKEGKKDKKIMSKIKKKSKKRRHMKKIGNQKGKILIVSLFCVHAGPTHVHAQEARQRSPDEQSVSAKVVNKK